MLKLIIHSEGDPTVGIFSETYEVPCPFSEADQEIREQFRDDILSVYIEYVDMGCTAWYSDERED